MNKKKLGLVVFSLLAAGVYSWGSEVRAGVTGGCQVGCSWIQSLSIVASFSNPTKIYFTRGETIPLSGVMSITRSNSFSTLRLSVNSWLENSATTPITGQRQIYSETLSNGTQDGGSYNNGLGLYNLPPFSRNFGPAYFTAPNAVGLYYLATNINGSLIDSCSNPPDGAGCHHLLSAYSNQTYRSTIRVYDPVSVTCSPNKTTATVGESITWTMYPKGGTGSYWTYWRGTDEAFTARKNNIKTLSKIYTTEGIKTMETAVVDQATGNNSANNGSGEGTLAAPKWSTCGSGVTVTLTPPSQTGLTITRYGRDLAWPSTAPAGTQGKVDSLPASSTNPSNFTNLSVGSHTVYSTDVAGYTETMGTCIYTVGETECSIPASSFSATTCSGGFCSMPATVVAGKVTKVGVRYDDIISNGAVKITRYGPDLAWPSTAPAGTQGKVDSLAVNSANPSDFTDLSAGSHTAYSTDVAGFSETFGTCTYAIGGTECNIPGSGFGVTPTCSGAFCSAPVNVASGQVAKVGVRYEVECPTGTHKGTTGICVCDNGATNTPTCTPPTTCPSGTHASGTGTCVCNNGASNPPLCTTDGTGGCLNGATNPPTCTTPPPTTCPATQKLDPVTNRCVCENGLNTTSYPSCVCSAGQYQTGSTCSSCNLPKTLQGGVCKCPSGTVESGNTCINPGLNIVTFKVRPDTVPINTPCNLIIQVEGASSCIITGNGNYNVSLDENGYASTTIQSANIANTTRFAATCVGKVSGSLPVVKYATCSIIPSNIED